MLKLKIAAASVLFFMASIFNGSVLAGSQQNQQPAQSGPTAKGHDDVDHLFET